MLLPISRRIAADMSLLNHLALAVCREGKGNSHLMNELVKTVYTVYYIQRLGFGDEPMEIYREAEAGLEDALAHAHLTNTWTLNSATASRLQNVLSLYDRQLASAATWMFLEARGQLDSFVVSDRRSPLSS